MTRIRLQIVTTIIILFFAGHVKSSEHIHAVETKDIKATNFISNNRYVKLSTLGFASNTKAANKRLMLGQSILFAASSASAPTELSEKLGNASSHVEHAKAVFDKVTKNRLFLTALKGKKIELPFGITKTIGQKEYTIVVDSIVITPEYAYGIVYTILQDPSTGNELAFGAKVTMSPDGGFASNGGKLYLLSDESIDFGQNTTIEFIGSTGGTYVEFDCNGFVGLQAQMKLTLLKNKLVLESDPTQDVSFFSDVYFHNFDDWVIDLSGLPPFQFRDLHDFTFSASYLALDRSPSENPESFRFPKGYSLGTDPNIWEGFCIKGLSVTLPPQFKKKGTDRITLSIDNAVIDKRGFTGLVSATNLITLEQGDMNGWAFSLEELSIIINQNQFNGLGFHGQIVLPVNKEEKPFAYTGIINVGQENRYFFSVETQENLQFPMWGAGQVELFSDSRLDVTVVNKTFVPEAVLSGRMSISASVNKDGENTPDDGASLELAHISFQQLHVTTKKPYLFLDEANGAFSVGSEKLEQAMAMIPVTLSDVGMVTEEKNGINYSGLLFTLRVNLTGNSDAGKGFGANSTAIVWGEKLTKKWAYDRCELRRLELERIEIGPLTMAGYVEFFREDDVYGTGFTGGLDLKIKLKSENSIGLKVAGIFGKILTEDNKTLLYRYWAVDALANFPKIPIVPSLLYANGFGGGASYRMTQQQHDKGSAKYVAPSGIGYVPSENTGLGLRAMMSIQGEMASVYNGEVAFEIVFDTDGSVEFITFSGFVAVASKGSIAGIDVDKVKKMAAKVESVTDRAGPIFDDPASGSDVKKELDNNNDAAIMAKWLMNMDFQNKTFSANVALYVNVLDIITGVNDYNNAGEIDILISPDKWYVHLGKPSAPLGLHISLLGVDITSYIMMGSYIETPQRPIGYSPDKPWGFESNVKEGSTKGFGFGSRIMVTMDRSGAFYYHISVGVGYDVLLRNVEGLVCAETGKSFGIKGWYATGMSYVWLDVDAGLEVCLNIPYAKCWKVWKSSCWGTRRECLTTNVNFNITKSITVNAPNPTNITYNMTFLGKDVPIKIGKTCSF